MKRLLAFVLLVLLYAAGALLAFNGSRCFGALPPDDPTRIVRITIERANGQTETLANTNFQPPATRPATAPTAGPKVKSWLGVNLNTLNSADPSMAFVDAMTQARKPGSYNKPEDQAGPVDVRGCPTGDAGGFVVIEDCGADCGGTYTLKAEKPTTFEGFRGSAVVGDKLVVPSGSTSVWFRWKGGAPGGPGKVKLLRPGYADDAQVFTTEFLTAVEPFGTIRFMDWSRTNSLLNPSFAERPKWDDQTYARGVPLERQVDLCNVAGGAGCDFWLNIPVLWTDADVAQARDLINARLKPGLFVYVEYGNELWNTRPPFDKQAAVNAAAARTESVSEPALTAGNTFPNYTYAAWRRVAKRAVQIRKVLGDDARYRVVLASQVGYANGGVLANQLKYVTSEFGEPKQFFYAVAGAPYFATPKAATQPASADAYADNLLSNGGAVWNDNSKAFARIAQQYGLKYLGYEGGIHDESIPFMVEAQSLPRVGEAVDSYLNQWQGDVFCYFSLCGRWRQGEGVWGATNDIRRLDLPKYQAIKRATTRRAA